MPDPQTTNPRDRDIGIIRECLLDFEALPFSEKYLESIYSAKLALARMEDNGYDN